jgi:hypothetical protein
MTKPVASAPTISLKVRRLEASDVADYRELRLESLKVHPEAFASSWESEGDKPISWWAERPGNDHGLRWLVEQFAARRHSWICGAGQHEVAA